jgi:two-component system, sensor histidine kinase and response regulator
LNSSLLSKLTLTSDARAGTGNAVGADSHRTLLVVDDDPSVRHALWITFKHLYSVQVAESGRKALNIFQQVPCDVVLLDIRMPEMNGLEVLRELKKLDPQVEVILLSAYESIEYVREAMRLGACEYVTKPYEVESLRLSVEGAMRRRETARKSAGYANKLAQLQNEIHHQQIREELARTRNEIYASIMHDITGPLTAIAGYSTMLEAIVTHAETLEADQVRALRRHSQAISRQVGNCINLSRRYLEFLEGRASSGSQATVNEVFHDVAELLRSHPQVRATELVIHPLESDVMPGIHRTDLLQILVNLTVNAVQAGRENSQVELSARVIPRGEGSSFAKLSSEVHFISAPDFNALEEFIAVTVQDNGPGIPEHLLSRVFEPYFSTKPPGQGTGLGLPIVQRLVLVAGGAVHLYSHPGERTIFTICLPLRSPPALPQ